MGGKYDFPTSAVGFTYRLALRYLLGRVRLTQNPIQRTQTPALVASDETTVLSACRRRYASLRTLLPFHHFLFSNREAQIRSAPHSALYSPCPSLLLPVFLKLVHLGLV